MVPSEEQEEVGAMPPDDWLTMSDAELAEHARHPAKNDVCLTDESVEKTCENEPDIRPMSLENPPEPNVSELDNAFQVAQSLLPFDRMRLIAKLWSTLTPRQRATLVSIQFDGFGGPVDGLSLSRLKQDPVVQAIRRFFVDTTDTPNLCSAPRRFDLATIFVVISAYSILFAALSLADRLFSFEFQPELTIIAGGLVTAVAIAQAWYSGIANPRGVSVIAGAISYTALCFIFAPFRFTIPGLFVVIVVNGMLLGAILGYIAGVFVGGMFLVADLLREKVAVSEAQEAPASRQNDFSSAANPQSESAIIDDSRQT
jgi:hypothetical protein